MSQKKPYSNDSLHFIAGGIGGCLGAIATQPLDVLKTRLQSSLQMQQTYKFGTRTIYGLQSTYLKEGVAGLFRGLIPNLVGVVPSRAIHLGSYNKAKQLLVQNSNLSQNSALVHIASAAAAGVVVPTVMNPIFLVKTRVQLETQSTNYLDCIKQIYAREGVRGFYKGLTASFLGIIESATYFVLYEKAKKLAEDRNLRNSPPGALTIFLIGGTCKLSASAITYPHEVVRTRMREIVNGQCRYPHLWSAFSTIFREEGYRGLYRGMGAHLIRVAPNAAIMFAVYEGLVRYGGTYLLKEEQESIFEEDGTDH